MNTSVRFETQQSIGVIIIDAPPVNAISAAVTAGLNQALDRFEADASLGALLVCCDGKTFVAGGDIHAFDDPGFSTATLNTTLARIESQTRPVIASLHGHTLGGGLELAMACHFRVAQPATRLGFPEIKLGIFPGSLGTQRLPRLVAVDTALQMMLGGQPITASRALEIGLIDEIATQSSPLAAGLAHAATAVALKRAIRATSQRAPRAEGLDADFFAKAMRDVEKRQGVYPAARAIVTCVEAAVTQPFEQGARLEARLFAECLATRHSRAMRHLFFAEREATRIPGLPSGIRGRPVNKVGIIGAGTMGGGIAMNFANIGLRTLILDVREESLLHGLATVQRNYDATLAKGRLTEEQVRQRMQCLQGTLRFEDLADCDLVIEAVFEDMALKQQVMAQLGKTCKPGAIIATNTSTLNVDVIARASGRPADVVGMHFFSPANVMRLLEVVRGAKTAPDVLLTVMEMARRIGKTAVVSGVCYGFIGNRMAEPYMRENEFLLMEGAAPADIDRAVENPDNVGMAMGPCRMLDMAGIDVGAKTLIELAKSGGMPDDPSYRAVCQQLHKDGRFGQKTGSGYYRYEGRTPLPEPLTAAISETLARRYGIPRRDAIPESEIVERLMLPLINEAARILEEGIAMRPGDIDVVWTAGYGFPDHRGGPLSMADDWGLAHVVERLEHYGRARGDRHGYWTPVKLLKQLASERRRISDWTPGQ